MPFGKDDAYFVASLLAGQLPIGKGAAWLGELPCTRTPSETQEPRVTNKRLCVLR